MAKNKKLFHLALAALMAASGLTGIVFVQKAHAVTTTTFVRFDHMQTSTFTTGTVCFKPATVGTEIDVVVAFPTGYTVSTTLGNWTVNTTNLSWPTGGTAWPGAGTATNASGQNVTFPSTDLTVGTLYCFNWTNTSAALQTPSGASSTLAGTVTTQATGPSTIDTASYSTAAITNEQIVVTATVPTAFTFALSGNTDTFGSLTVATPTAGSNPRTATVNTNAKNGWMMWAKDTSTGLASAAAAYTIPSKTPGSSAATLTGATEGYNTGTTSSLGGGAAITLDANYASGGTSFRGGGLDTSLRLLASATGVANAAAVTLTNNVNVVGSTPAANDYTDTITVVAAGLF